VVAFDSTQAQPSRMLDDFIAANHDSIIARAKARAALRTPKPHGPELANGVPVFLHQLGEALRLARSTGKIDHEQISASAGRHGHDLLRMGLSIRQVVHDYGDVCQVITELAVQAKTPISGEEFRTLNLCLDDAIAAAVTEYARQRESSITNHGTERLGFLAHELRNLLNTATLSFDSIRSGRVAVGGSTSLVHSRTLLGLRDLIDRSLAEVRLDAGVEHSERISAFEFVEEVEISALLEAQSRGVHLTVAPIDRTITIQGDRQILAAAVSNLLQNAFKFTRKQSHVSLSVRATAERVFFDIEDECGGLPPGKQEDLFRPFEQRGSDRSGAGLGLTICLKAAKANAGEIHVRDLPGKGCIFTLELPRLPPPPLSVVDGGKSSAGGSTGRGGNDARSTSTALDAR
jgi:signal transduction histidine kinase